MLCTVLSSSILSVGVVTNEAAVEARPQRTQSQPQHAEGSNVHCRVLSSSTSSDDVINENDAANDEMNLFPE